MAKKNTQKKEDEKKEEKKEEQKRIVDGLLMVDRAPDVWGAFPVRPIPDQPEKPEKEIVPVPEYEAIHLPHDLAYFIQANHNGNAYNKRVKLADADPAYTWS
jgi:hypothetical protein